MSKLERDSVTVAFTKCPTCGSDSIKRCGAVRDGLAARTSLCSRNAHDEAVLDLGKERFWRSGGRVRMWRAVGIALAARPERVTGLRSVTAKRMFGGCARQKLPCHPDLRMGVKKIW